MSLVGWNTLFEVNVLGSSDDSYSPFVHQWIDLDRWLDFQQWIHLDQRKANEESELSEDYELYSSKNSAIFFICSNIHKFS